jgi:hypothetical protein
MPGTHPGAPLPNNHARFPAPGNESPVLTATMRSLEAVMLFTVPIQTLGADGADCRINNAAVEVGTADVWGPRSRSPSLRSGCIMPTRVKRWSASAQRSSRSISSSAGSSFRSSPPPWLPRSPRRPIQRRARLILTAGSDSNNGGPVCAVAHPHGQAPAGGGRCWTSGHRFGSEGHRYSSEVPQPWSPSQYRTELTRRVTSVGVFTRPCCRQLWSRWSRFKVTSPKALAKRIGEAVEEPTFKRWVTFSSPHVHFILFEHPTDAGIHRIDRVAYLGL